MKKSRFKDFIYNSSDILVVIAIIAVACLIILWRLGIIMDYPNTL